MTCSSVSPIARAAGLDRPLDRRGHHVRLDAELFQLGEHLALRLEHRNLFSRGGLGRPGANLRERHVFVDLRQPQIGRGVGTRRSSDIGSGPTGRAGAARASCPPCTRTEFPPCRTPRGCRRRRRRRWRDPSGGGVSRSERSRSSLSDGKFGHATDLNQAPTRASRDPARAVRGAVR